MEDDYDITNKINYSLKMIKSNNKFNLRPLLKEIDGNKILDYRYRTRLDNDYIPQYFNNKIVFISYASFQQKNYILSKHVRKYVITLITTKYINAIGGESYMYSNNQIEYINNINYNIGYTNSLSIKQDAIYNRFKNMNIIDYNKDKINITTNNTVINMSKLNQNIVKQLNDSISNRLIIINCHHDDFWKKIKLLTNYKLVRRKIFTDYKSRYFITVNILIRKSFVSLGSNCAVTYNLKKIKLRNKAFAFDWSKNKLPNIINAYKFKFKDFEQLEIVKHNSYIVKNKYMTFAHEVLSDDKLDTFKDKLLRRIERIKNIKNPVFVRIETFSYKNEKVYSKYWNDIIKILDKVYDSYSIILISKIKPKFNYNHHIKPHISTNKIKWINYQEFSNDWKNQQLNWLNILTT